MFLLSQGKILGTLQLKKEVLPKTSKSCITFMIQRTYIPTVVLKGHNKDSKQANILLIQDPKPENRS